MLKNKSEVCYWKKFSKLLSVEKLGYGNGFNKFKPIQSEIYAIHQVPSRNTKNELLRFIDSINFCSKSFVKLYFKMKLLFDLLPDKDELHCNKELETPFRQIEATVAKNLKLTLPNTSLRFFNAVGFSLIGIGCVLFQMNTKRKMDVVLQISRIFTTNE